MILGFKETFPTTKEPTNFREKILGNTKIHTIRNGYRWKPGMKINFATGVRTKNYNQFKEGICISVQAIEIGAEMHTIKVDGHTITARQFIDLFENDGFETYFDFWNWFKKDVVGQIIHWTDYKY
jgi:hypothetical protein